MREPSNQTRSRVGFLVVCLFTISYLFASGIGALLTGNREFVFYVVVTAALGLVVLGIHARVDLGLGVLWGLSIWGLVHMAGGLCPVPASWPTDGPHRVLYSWWLFHQYLKYDQLVHAFGFGVTTWACWRGLQALLGAYSDTTQKSPIPTLGALTLCGAAAMGFGAVNELVEFLAVLFIPNTNVGGYMNTGWDLVANFVGVLVSCIALRIRYRQEFSSVF